MAYPNLPKNRLILVNTPDGEVDLTEEFKMILGDGYTLSPPEPKTYTVDIPGGNGSLDLTESLTGDVAYGNRKMEFTFYIVEPESFETAKKNVSNYLHGKDFDYRLTMDPGYIYHGRFSVKAYSHKSYASPKILGEIKVEINADPYKIYEQNSMTVQAAGGVLITLEGSRMRTIPRIKANSTTYIELDGQKSSVNPGNEYADGIALKDGQNEMYLNSYPTCSVTWGDLKRDNIRWGDLLNTERKVYDESKGGVVVRKEQPARLFDWYRYITGSASEVKDRLSPYIFGQVEYDKWGDKSTIVIGSIGSKKISELKHVIENHVLNPKFNSTKVQIDYEKGDL